MHTVDAALKRHEAISADVHAGVSNSFKHWPFVRFCLVALEKSSILKQKPEFELREQGHVHLLVTYL